MFKSFWLIESLHTHFNCSQFPIFLPFSNSHLNITKQWTVLLSVDQSHQAKNTTVIERRLQLTDLCTATWNGKMPKKIEEETLWVLFAYNRVEDIAYARTTESKRCIEWKQCGATLSQWHPFVCRRRRIFPYTSETRTPKATWFSSPKTWTLNTSCCERQAHNDKNLLFYSNR